MTKLMFTHSHEHSFYKIDLTPFPLFFYKAHFRKDASNFWCMDKVCTYTICICHVRSYEILKLNIDLYTCLFLCKIFYMCRILLFFKLAYLIIFNLLCVAMSVDNGKITKCRLIIMISFQSENNEWARSVKLGEGLLWPAKSTKTLFIFLITSKIWSDTPPFPSEQQNGFTSALLQWILSPVPKQWTIFSWVNLSLSTSM